jgi:predicted membrane protein
MEKILSLEKIIMKENRRLLKEVLRDVRHDMTDEEVLNLLADSQISARPENDRITLGQRAADAIARFAGSWAFIFSFTGVLAAWMVINVILAAKAFDPYPFILLNLVLSCVAAIQAPLIMMSQNRQEEKDRRRAENDYKVNLKTEIMIEDLYDKLNAVLAKQTALEKRLNDGDKTGSQS